MHVCVCVCVCVCVLEITFQIDELARKVFSCLSTCV